MASIPVQFALDPGVQLPLDARTVGTTTERDEMSSTSLYTGLLRYNTTLERFEFYDSASSAWKHHGAGLSKNNLTDDMKHRLHTLTTYVSDTEIHQLAALANGGHTHTHTDGTTTDYHDSKVDKDSSGNVDLQTGTLTLDKDKLIIGSETVTRTAQQLNYVDVSSEIQGLLDLKVDKEVTTGNVTIDGTLQADGNVTIGTETDGANLTVHGSIEGDQAAMSTVVDTTTTPNVSWARFSHKDAANATDFAIAQNADGQVLINAASGQNVRIAINTDTGIQIDNSDVDVYRDIKLHPTSGPHLDAITLARNGNITTTGTVIAPGHYTNLIHAPTSGNTWLMLKGGNANGATLNVGGWNINYKANRHYFYNRTGGTFNYGASDGVYFMTTLKWRSDDRLKHNEVDVTNALATVRQLTAQKYQKTDEPKDADFNGELTEPYVEETGFIAQDVMAIPELAYCVSEGVTAEGKDVYYLNYNDIFVVNVQAVKELDQIVQSQAALITALEARVAALESA